MDLQRRIGRLLAWLGTGLLAAGLLVPALGGDAAAAPDGGKTDETDEPVTTTTSSESTSTSTTERKKRRQSTTTTTEPAGGTTPSTEATTTSSAPSTTSTSTASSTTTTSTSTSTTATSTSTTSTTAPAATTSSTARSGSASNRQASTGQVGPTTTSTLYDQISRGPKSPVTPPPADGTPPASPPPAAPVTSSTVRNPTPPATVANPLPRTPATASSPRPNPLRLEAEETPATAGPGLPSDKIPGVAPEGESPRGAQGAAAPAAAQAPRQLGATGSGTRTLLFLAGIALLLGALAVAFGEPGALRTVTEERRRPTRARRRARTFRRTLPGWESGVPHAPLRRAAKRTRLQRQGLLGTSPPDGGPAA